MSEYHNVNNNKNSLLNVKTLNSPVSVALYITLKCNISCLHCAYRCSPFRSEIMNLDSLTKILEKLYRGEVFEIGLIGGEPLIHPQITEVFKLLNKYNFTWTISTNALLIEKNTKILDYLIMYEPSTVQVSLYGHTPKVHNIITQGNTFDRIVKAIENLRSVGLHVVINSVLHRELCRNISRFIKFLEERKLKANIGALIPMGAAIDNWRKIAPSKSELLCALSIIRMYRSRILYGGVTIELGKPCNAGRTIMVVDPEGYCYPCDLALESDLFRVSKCNLLKYNLSTVWNSKPFQVFREATENRNVCPALSWLHYRSLHLNFQEVLSRFYGFKLSENISLSNLMKHCNIKIKINKNAVKVRDEKSFIILYNKVTRDLKAISRELFDTLLMLDKGMELKDITEEFKLTQEEANEFIDSITKLIELGYLDLIQVH